MMAPPRTRTLTWLAQALVVVSVPCLLGMGALGGAQDVVQPAVDLKATATDKDGVRVALSRVSTNGRLYLEGQMGRGKLRIPFENIARIEFDGGGRDSIRARVVLAQGESVELQVRSSLTFHGQTDVGIYEIRARDLKRIDFDSRDGRGG